MVFWKTNYDPVKSTKYCILFLIVLPVFMWMDACLALVYAPWSLPDSDVQLCLGGFSPYYVISSIIVGAVTLYYWSQASKNVLGRV